MATKNLSALVIALAAALSACGGESPLAPSPAPGPSRVTIAGTLTDTVSGAVIGSFSQDVTTLPASVTVSATGHLSRTTTVASASPTVDLIPDAAPFSLDFYRQFARGTLENPMQPLRILTQAPSIYLQTAGLSPANIAALEQAARTVVPAFTGDRFQVQQWETGDAVRNEQPGWIVVDLFRDEAQGCGRSLVGAAAGHIWQNTATKCNYQGNLIDPSSFGHELGHALGFDHVNTPGAIMSVTSRTFGQAVVTEQERYHAAIAYHRSRGNRDADVD